MTTLYNHKDANIRRTWFLMGIFLLFVIGVGAVFSYVLDNQAILFGAVFISIFMNIFSYWFSDKIVLSMSQAHELKQTTSEGKEIYRLVENLAITAGLPVPKVYIIQDTAMNAFATGRNPDHAVIALTTGIIARLEKKELEGVIAHELSHIGNRDILVQTVAVVLVGLVVLLSDWFLRMSFWGGSRRNSEEGDNNGSLGMVIGIIAIVLAIIAPIFAQLLQLAISRKREFLADASGALLTRYPDGLASALKKIASDTEPLEVANRATAHLFISSPFQGKSDKRFQGLIGLFSTHPPTQDRIKALGDIHI